MRFTTLSLFDELPCDLPGASGVVTDLHSLSSDTFMRAGVGSG